MSSFPSAEVVTVLEKPQLTAAQQQQLSPRMKKNALILIGIAVFTLILVAALTMYEQAHDPDWWKHVGIRHDRGGKASAGADGKVILLDDGNMFMVPNGRSGGGKDSHRDDKPLNGRGAESRRIIDVSQMRNGSDFIADYDVMQIKEPGPPLGATNCAFPYLDLTSPNSTWVGKWVSNWPNVAIIPEFMTDKECDALVEEAKRSMFRSQVAPFKGSGASPVNDVRTSSQAWLNPGYGMAKVVVDRIMQMLSPTFGPNAHEELQILRYDQGQHYDSHHDFFDPTLYGKQASNRAVTVFLYLTDVPKGGETVFPRAGGRPPPLEYKSCDKGLRVKPMKRACIVFYDMDCTGRLDTTSLHGGCPPQEGGTKFAGTLWVRRATP